MELHCGSSLPGFLGSIFGERFIINPLSWNSSSIRCWIRQGAPHRSDVLSQESCHPRPVLQLIMCQTDVNGEIIAFGLQVFAICKISQVNCESSFFFPIPSSSLTGGSSMARFFGWSYRSSCGQLNPPNNLEKNQLAIGSLLGMLTLPFDCDHDRGIQRRDTNVKCGHFSFVSC